MQVAGNVIHHLSDEPGPVNRVYGTDAVVAFEVGIGRHGLDYILTIIEHSFEGNVEDVGIVETEHLCLLEWGHAAGRSEHEYLNAVPPTHGVFGSRPGVARSCPHNGEGFTPPAQLVFEKFPEQLHGNVFKSCGGPLGKMTNVHAIFQLGHRHDFGMSKLREGVGAVGDGGKIIGGNVVDK